MMRTDQKERRMGADIPVPEIPADKLQDIKDAYNRLIEAVEKAGLPGPPKWN